MLATSAPFTTMVEGLDQTLAWRLTMTLPAAASAYDDLTFTVDSVSIDASTTTDMPAGSRLEVGYPSAQADFTLSGMVDPSDESKTAAWLFGRYRTDSPLYRQDVLFCEVTIDLGLYPDGASGVPEYVRKFTGLVEDYSEQPDGKVQFTCIEKLRQQLRSVPDLSQTVATDDYDYSGNTTAEYVIDSILRAATAGAVSTWPVRRTDCILAVGLRASIHPEVGAFQVGSTLNNPADGVYFRPGAFGSALVMSGTPGNSVAWSPSVPVVLDKSKTIGLHFECWTGLSSGTKFILYGVGAVASVSVALSGSTLTANVWGHTATASLTVPAGLHYFAADFTLVINSGGVITWAGTATLDATVVSFGSGHAGGTVVTAQSLNRFGAGGGAAGDTIEALQVTTETAAASNYGFDPQAVLDPSLNPILVIPAVSGDPYQVLQGIADAELAVTGGDESGVFRFYNRDTIAASASVRDITSSESLTAVGGITTGAAGVVNRCTVEYQSWTLPTLVPSTIWSLDALTKVPAHGSAIIQATTTDLIFDLAMTPPTVLPNGSAVIGNFYRASTDKAGTTEHPGGLTFTLAITGPTTFTVTVANPTSTTAWLVTPAVYTDIDVGTPLLRISGDVISAANTLTVDFQYPPLNADGTGGARSSRFGEVAHSISGNQWIQDAGAAEALTQHIVVDQCVPRPDLTGVAIVPDPRLQLVDVVHVLDPDVSDVDEYARLFGWSIHWEGGDGGAYEMTIDARTIAAPGGWIMGLVGRSEIGSTAYVYPAA